MEEVHVTPHPLGRFAPLVGEERLLELEGVAERTRALLHERVVWNVNSTSAGGGVAEMLRSLLAYVRAAGVDARWVVVEGRPDFFHVTKRLHHALHGSAGDGSPLDAPQRRIYEAVCRDNAVELAALVRPGDVVLLHDPQTAGLIEPLQEAGARVIWRSHIGTDRSNPEVERAWAFLEPYVSQVEATVFTRAAYRPPFCNAATSHVIPPSIDAFSVKNLELEPGAIRAILAHAGLVDAPPGASLPTFVRSDGAPGRVDRRADVLRAGPAPTWETPLVVQVSRWDPLKDPVGVLQGFAMLVNGHAPAGAHLVLAGPSTTGVTDDPEQGGVWAEVVAAWRALPDGARQAVHLVCLPMDDVEENAAIVNALQRHASVVVQKSLQEGFGLTVTEAMWKARPVVASAVGGIQDQIEHRDSGLLLDDPGDLEGFAALLQQLLEDRDCAERLGGAARERVRQRFLGTRHLLEYARLIEALLARPHEG